MKSIKEFSVGSLIGKGGFGKVYRAVLRQRPSEAFAIKVMSKRWLRDKGLLNRVAEEIKLHLSLKRHPNIVKMYSFFEDKAHLYLVLELCEEGNLFQYLKKKKGLDQGLIRKWFREIVTGVAFLHENDVVHRDLKLSNILISKSGEVKVSDFGLAARIEDREHHTVCGTPYYMAPEVRSHNRRSGLSYDPVQADLWSLGCLLYTLVNDGKHLEPKQKYKRTKLIRDENTHELLRRLLNYELDRSSALEILEHPYLNQQSSGVASLKGSTRSRSGQGRESGISKPEQRIPERISFERIDVGDVRGVRHQFGAHTVQICRDGSVLVTVRTRGKEKEIFVRDRMPEKYQKLQQFATKAVSILVNKTPKVVLRVAKPEEMTAVVVDRVAKVWFHSRNISASYDLDDQYGPKVKIEGKDYPIGPIESDNPAMYEFPALVQYAALRCLELEVEVHRKRGKHQVFFPIIVHEEQVAVKGVGRGLRNQEGDVTVLLDDGTSLILDRTASIVTHGNQSYALLRQPETENLPQLPSNLRTKLRDAQRVVNELIERN